MSPAAAAASRAIRVRSFLSRGEATALAAELERLPLQPYTSCVEDVSMEQEEGEAEAEADEDEDEDEEDEDEEDDAEEAEAGGGEEAAEEAAAAGAAEVEGQHERQSSRQEAEECLVKSPSKGRGRERRHAQAAVHVTTYVNTRWIFATRFRGLRRRVMALAAAVSAREGWGQGRGCQLLLLLSTS